MWPYFTIFLENPSKDAIALEDLAFRFKLLFRQDYKMEPIIFKYKDISISKTTLAQGETLEIEINEDLYRKIKAGEVIPNVNNIVDKDELENEILNLLQGIQFEVLDQEGNVIEAHYEEKR